MADIPLRDEGASPEGSHDLPAPLFVRSPTDRVLTGVAAGLAARFGMDPLVIRLGFVVLALAGGAGIVLYAVLWLLSTDGAAPAPVKLAPDAAVRRLIAVGLMVTGALLLLRAAGIWFGDALVWPVMLAAAGSVLIWTRGDADERARWSRLAARLPGRPVQTVLTGPVSVLRVLGGGLLIVAGMGAFLAAHDALAAARNVLFSVAVTVIGIGLVFGPWLLRLARQASEERRKRIRSEERAEMAAQLHDSVLQTLALIQRTDDRDEAVALARGQERELRAWLYGRAGTNDVVSAALDEMAGRVERLHHVSVDTVVVGDTRLDDKLRAVVDACGEATMNAAKHSGAKQIAVFVEIEQELVTAYVRDDGKGFDPNTVPEDRRGIADSIVGRIERNGGTASIVSAVGEGTDVEISLPRWTL
ncbi:MAG TPA: PspC domain-containing protein [Actinomycetota bacterium]|jgi:signal transduction histidine kinase|nr:PspC domain-containing protein [Actinomycetota bacterium]